MLEIFGVVVSLLYLFLELKQKPAMWVVGFVSSLAYVFIFYQNKFYADMSMNVYYVFMSVYGFYVWKFGNKSVGCHPEPVEGVQRGDKPNGSVFPVSRARLRHVVVLTLIAAVLFFAISYVLKNYTDSTVPLGDALTTALSVVATWMLARKILEHWLLWVFIDFASAALYFYKDMYPTAALFVVYGALSVYGYFSWKKTMAK